MNLGLTLKSLDLVLGTTLATGDNGACVTHATAGGSSSASDERDDWLRLGLYFLFIEERQKYY